MRAQGTPEMIRDMRRGHVPSVERLRSLCAVLDLEFYVGPRQAGWHGRADAPGVPLSALERTAQDLAQLTADAGGDPVSDDLWSVLAARRAAALPPVESERTQGELRSIEGVPPGADESWMVGAEHGWVAFFGLARISRPVTRKGNDRAN